MNSVPTEHAIHADIPDISYNTEQGQRLFLVMVALEELVGENTKQATIDHILGNGWYIAVKGDFETYQSTGEARVKIWFAWARKHAVIRDWIFNNQRDAWALSRAGKLVLNSSRKKFQDSKWDAGQCPLWSLKFKRLLQPKHEPSIKDRPRPPARPPRSKRNFADEALLKELEL